VKVTSRRSSKTWGLIHHSKRILAVSTKNHSLQAVPVMFPATSRREQRTNAILSQILLATICLPRMTTNDVSATHMAKENRTAHKRHRPLFFNRVVMMMIALRRRVIITSTCMLKRSIHKLTMFLQAFSSIPNSVHPTTTTAIRTYLPTMIVLGLSAESKQLTNAFAQRVSHHDVN